jgi:outer membrane lipoprotein-sorting protein
MVRMRRNVTWMALAGALAAMIGPGPMAARPLAAQELADVLARHYEAIGGENAWRSLRSARRTGTLSLMGGAVAGEITAVSARPQKFRTEITVQGTQILQGYDGESGWQYNPLAGMAAPEAADRTVSEMMSEQADLDGALVGWRDEGHSIVVAGTETVDGSEMIVLEVTFPTGNVSHYYLDAQSYLLVQVVETRPLTGEMTRTVSDYRDVGGLMVPFRIHSTSAQGDQEVIWDTYEIDVEVDDSVFSMPEGP